MAALGLKSNFLQIRSGVKKLQVDPQLYTSIYPSLNNSLANSKRSFESKLSNIIQTVTHKSSKSQDNISLQKVLKSYNSSIFPKSKDEKKQKRYPSIKSLYLVVHLCINELGKEDERGEAYRE